MNQRGYGLYSYLIVLLGVFFQVLRFMERGTEGKCVMLTQVNGLLGAGVVAWRARDVLGWVTCYVR